MAYWNSVFGSEVASGPARVTDWSLHYYRLVVDCRDRTQARINSILGQIRKSLPESISWVETQIDRSIVEKSSSQLERHTQGLTVQTNQGEARHRCTR